MHPFLQICQDRMSQLTSHQQHQRIHEPKDVRCLGFDSGCSRAFESMGAVMLHLEAGECVTGADIDIIDSLTLEFCQRRKYTNSSSDWYRYECPDCGKDFLRMSGLLQHADSFACDADADEELLSQVLRFIETRL